MTQSKYYKFAISLFIVIFLTGCKQEENPIYPSDLVDFSSDFNRVWSKYDSLYPLFTYKNIDWIEIYNNQIEKFRELSSVYERDNLLLEMLSIFKDQHIYVVSANGVGRTAWNTPYAANINENILNNYKNKMCWKQIDIFWGWGNLGNIGYIKIDYFDFDSFDVNSYDEVINNLTNTDGLILDLRENRGGMLLICLKILGRFIDKEKDFCYVIRRNGSGYDDFITPLKYTMSPRGNFQYNKPIVVLIGKATASCGEVFAEAINYIEHATLIGETTQGNVVSTSKDTLNDGTIYTIPTMAFLKLDMQPFEDNGVAPNIHLDNIISHEDSLDPILEYSIEYINNRTYNMPLKTDRRNGLR